MAESYQNALKSEFSVISARAMESALANAPFRLPADPAEADLLAKYFRVLGDRTRLRVLELVSEQECSVGELVELLGEPQTKVSNHLACLRWCGFVATRREHRTIHYRLADARVTAVIQLGRALLRANEEHVAACRRVDGRGC
jgi:ArsR family transcriptional regulator, cadmium/lead-responsive transcriptional repressor